MLEKFEVKIQSFSGYLAKDPELKYLESGKALCKLSIPLKVNKDDEATWLNVECWNGAAAERIAESYKKNDLVTVSGKVKEKEFNGKTSYILELTSIL